MGTWKLEIGASVIDGRRTSFRVWAPKAEKLSVKITAGQSRGIFPLHKCAMGYYEGTVENVIAGDRYLYLMNNENLYPDPASRFQPEGVHAASQVIDPDEFTWEDGVWKGLPIEDFIIYELHIGTFTKDGTFESVIPYIAYLKDLGITAMEIMPVAQFPGDRNWGYDGACSYAPQNSYGGPGGLKKLINACHKNGLAVILDVVYNHLGPEGNYLSSFGPYFTGRYKTPWGDAVNFDGPFSDEVRNFFISNALYWITEYHIDALRIDAIHGIFDFRAKHFLQDLGEAVHKQAEALKRNIYVIAESDLNDAKVINHTESGGYGLDAQWNDDFHHALHVLLTEERRGYYEDFGMMEHLEKALMEGFVYSGQYSKFRKRRHGSSSINRPAKQFIVFSQNHDQVGNRMKGDRPGRTQPFEKLKLAAGMVILSPYIPLFFMGEEYGETSPFQYFVSFSDAALIAAVRKGRREEFAAFEGEGEVPDPHAEDTFFNSKIDIEKHGYSEHKILFEFYKKLIRLRKEVPALSNLSKECMEVTGIRENTPLTPLDRGESERKVLFVRRWFEGDETFCLYNFNKKDVKIRLPLPNGLWLRILASSSEEWGGDGSVSVNKIESNGQDISLHLKNHSFILYRRDVSAV